GLPPPEPVQAAPLIATPAAVTDHRLSDAARIGALVGPGRRIRTGGAVRRTTIRRTALGGTAATGGTAARGGGLRLGSADQHYLGDRFGGQNLGLDATGDLCPVLVGRGITGHPGPGHALGLDLGLALRQVVGATLLGLIRDLFGVGTVDGPHAHDLDLGPVLGRLVHIGVDLIV